MAFWNRKDDEKPYTSYPDNDVDMAGENEMDSVEFVISFEPTESSDDEILDEEISIYNPNDESETKMELSQIEIAKKLKKELPKYVYGQDYVIEKIVDYFKNNLIQKTGPKATFLFLGPPATGKTYLAQTMAKILDGYKFKMFDMSQFTDEKSAHSLYGSGYFYANANVGLLTEFVLKNPKSIIVFDEIEKAHDSIQNAFLSVFNTGKMVDLTGWVKENGEYISYGTKKEHDKLNCPTKPEIQEVDFSNTILIFTSNLGKDLYSSKYFWDIVKNDYKKAEDMIIESLQKETKINNNGKKVPAITPPLLSRLTMGEILLFKRLDFENVKKIAFKGFKEYQDAIKSVYKIKIKNIDEILISILTLTFAPRVDIRRLKSKIGSYFFDIVGDYIFENDLEIESEKVIEVFISDKVKEFFKENIENQKDILKFMFRKNLTLKIKKNIEYRQNIFYYKIEDVCFEKVTNITDIGDDGIIFEVPDIKFDDIVGHETVKKRLKETAFFLKNPKKIKEKGIDLPKGMLLYGKPGTGKTMLAKALANEASLPFLSATGTDLLNIEKMEKIFDLAKEYAPSIIFIDEFDSIGSRNSSQRDIFVNKLLSKINGFNDEEEIFVIAATNYPEKIDPAILRPGRIDLHFEIQSLDKKARKYFIEKIINHFDTKGEFDIDKLVVLTTDMTGAEFDKVKRELGLEMIRNSIEHLDEKLLTETILRIKYGEKLENIDILQTLEATAIHEAAHAVISKILRPEVKIEHISIVPRSKALGFVAVSEEGKLNYSKEDIKNQIQILLAGREAQIKKYGEKGIDSGASDDLKKATDYVYKAIVEYGMDDEVNFVKTKKARPSQERINKLIEKWIKEAKENVSKLIDSNWDKIQKVANALLDKEILDEGEFLEVISENNIINK